MSLIKDGLIKFINSYDKKIIIKKEKVEHLQYENKDQIFIDLGKQDLTNILFMLEEDFEIEKEIINLEDGFLVYHFYITNDVILGQYDIENNGELQDVFNVNTSVRLITRNYKNIYHSYLNSKEWHDKRNTMLNYADYKCGRCNKTENLQVHHLNYNTIGYESLSDLEVVCNGCHKKIHNIIK